MPVKEKISLLEAVLSRMGDNIVEWGKATATVKGNTDDALVPIEAMVTTAAPVTYMSSLLRTLRALAAGGPLPALPTRTLPNGQVAVQVFPAKDDRVALLQPGAVGELVLLPGEGQGDKGVRRAELYGGPNGTLTHQGRVCVVLGAGNQGFLTFKDALFALFERGEVVAVKPHPIMKQWTPYMRHVLQPLVEAGFVRVLELDTVADTQALLYHPLVDCVHITGGTATHDAIVWGNTPEEQQRRRADNDPKLKVPITSELGCVTPVMIAPGSFTPAELLCQVRNVAVAVASNNGCNCNSHKVLVLPGDWAQADEFLALLRKEMREYVREPPYYPGIRKRYEAFKAHYPNCEVIEPTPPGMGCTPEVGPHLPFLLNIMDKLPEDPRSEPAFQVEPFAPVLTVVRLPTQGVTQFLEEAVRFANEDLWGTLSCTLVLHPNTEKQYPAESEKAICDLRYGVVGVNTWSATAVITGVTTWGAFAGDQTIADVGSGIGSAGNSYLVEGVQKAVYRTPVAGLAVPMPAHRSPYSKPVVKVVCGYLLGGLWGVAKALLRSR